MAKLFTVDDNETEDGLPLTKLAADFEFRIPGVLDGIVPKGYITNYASVPWFGRWLVSPVGKIRHAAVVHDWLCDTGVGRALAARPRFLLRPNWRTLLG